MNRELLASLVGIPYVSTGRNPAVGLDCWGLVVHASAVLFQRELPDYRGYANACDHEQTTVLFEERSKWQRIAKGDEIPGDVLLLRLAGHPVHAGLVVGDNLMLHTLTGRNATLERYDSLSPWYHRWEGVYRWQTI